MVAVHFALQNTYTIVFKHFYEIKGNKSGLWQRHQRVTEKIFR